MSHRMPSSNEPGPDLGSGLEAIRMLGTDRLQRIDPDPSGKATPRRQTAPRTDEGRSFPQVSTRPLRVVP
jgi:hypothetical protein